MAAKKAPTAAVPPASDLPASTLPGAGDPDALYIVDLSGYVFRAYHAVAPLSNAQGEPTHAVFGTVQMLQRLVDERRPGHLAIAMDSKGPSFRKALDERYKANRPEPPPDLSSQMQRCEEIVRAYRIPTLRREGVEADDLIAALTVRARREQPTLRVVIVSADKDLMQLVDDRVVLWDSMRDRVFGRREVIEKFGVGPEQLRDLLALMGDSSDNVPGVAGVGPKTAADLLKQFGTLEAMYERIGEVAKPKLRDALVAAEVDARLSQRLVTLKDDEEVELDLDALRYERPKGDIARDLSRIFRELGFNRLVGLMDKAADGPLVTTAASSPADGAGSAVLDRTVEPSNVVVPAVADTRVYRTITTRDDLIEFVRAARASITSSSDGALALDTESTSLRTADATLVGISLAFTPNEAIYVPITHRYLGVPAQLPIADVRELLGPLFADTSIAKVGHNLKFDAEMLLVAGMPLAGPSFDTLLAHYLLDPEAPHGLKELARSELGVTMTTYDQVTRKDAIKRGQQLSFEEVPIEEATPYAAADAALSLELSRRLLPRLEGAGVLKLLTDVEMPLSEMLVNVELAGVLVDVERLKVISNEVDGQLRALEEQAREILRAAPEAAATPNLAAEFNLGSPRQLEAILFDVLKLPVVKRTKTARSTDAEVLDELASKHPLPAVVLDHRQLQKLKGTYLDALPRLVSPRTGRVHTNFQQQIAATGRLSSTDPNLQNIPIRTEVGRSIRAAFIAPPGFVLMSADYSQIELRVLADLANDEILIDGFKHGEDVHARTARELFMEAGATEAPSKEMRRRAKAVNFGVVYGQGENALAKQLGIARQEAAEFIARYFERYAGVRRYMDAQIEQARRGEGVRTLLGRRRFLPDIHSSNRALRLQAERIARNTPIQGTAADILKLAMIALKGPPVEGARMLLTVHDELVFEVPEAHVDEAARVVKETMEGVAKLAVPLVVDVGWGRTWADAHG